MFLTFCSLSHPLSCRYPNHFLLCYVMVKDGPEVRDTPGQAPIVPEGETLL